MKKAIMILFIMVVTTAFITGCSKDNGKNLSNDTNTTDGANDSKSEDGNDDTNDNVTDEGNDDFNNNEDTAVGNSDNGDSDSSNSSDITVDDILSSIKAAYGESYMPNVEILPDFLELEFGLTSDMYVEVKAEQPMIGTHADRVVIVKAAEGKTDDVETALIAAKENKINDTLQYPMNLPKINATKVVRNEDFVCFLLVGALNDNVDATEEEAMQFAEDEVQKGVNAFNDLFK